MEEGPSPRIGEGDDGAAVPLEDGAAQPQAQPEPAMMNRGKPNTSPDPFINNYLKRSYVGTGQG